MLKNRLLIFPTSRSIREYIVSVKQNNALLEKCITIGDFFQRVVIEKDNKILSDKNLKILFLQKAIENIDIKKLGLNSNFSTFIKQSDYIFRFFNELNNEYVSLDTLLEFDTYALYEEHIFILKEIYKNYQTLLEKSIYTDSIFLPYNYKINFKYLDQFSTIEIHQEGYLTKFEYTLLKEISHYKQLIIDIFFNQYNQKNITLFDNLTINLGYYYKIDLSKNTILNSFPIENHKQNIIITPINSIIEQIGFIKYQITSMVKSGIDPNKIAVLLPDESFAKTLKIFDDEHYFNFAMGEPIDDRKIVKVVEFINKILIDTEPLDDIKYNFFSIDNNIFNIIKTNWSDFITLELFNTIIDFIFNYEDNQDILNELENLKIYLKNLIFNKNLALNFSLTLKEFFKILYNELITISIDDTRGGKITVLGILETRLVQFDGIIIVNFNDNKIPKISIKDKFLSSKIKELVNLPSLDDRYNLQRYYYKRFLDGAKSIAISYVDDESNLLSRFVTQLYPNYKEFIKKEDYSSILYKKHSIELFYKDIILDIDLSTLQWSATKLKSYLTCKREFYFRYILNIKDHNISLKPQSFDIGNIVHNTLEKGVKNNSLTNEFINSEFNKYAKSNPYLTLELELWKKRLENFIALEQKRKEQGIIIFDVEREFKVNYNGINLTGKIDRIDKHIDNSYEILDYKTSSSLKIDTIKTYEKSCDFQLEFYYLATKDRMIRDVSYYDLYNCSIKPETVLKNKLDLLDLHFKTLKTTKVDFKLTDNPANCNYCIYKTICQRD